MKKTMRIGVLSGFIFGLIVGAVVTYSVTHLYPSRTVEVLVSGRVLPAGAVLEADNLGCATC